MIRFERASCWYGSVVALSDVTCEIGPGITGLLGPNGAGKTSFLRTATGQLRPRGGRVLLDGRSPWNDPPLLARIGLATETDSFWPELTGRQYLEALLALSGYGRSDRRERAASALERVGLAAAADRATRGYSKGMKQRLKLAGATAHDPDYVLLDEPFEGADPLGRRDLMQLTAELGRAGKVVVLSSHVLHEVEQVADRVVVLLRGKLVATGTAAEIRRDLDRHPTEIAIAGRNLRELAARLARDPQVERLAIEAAGTGERLTVATRDPARCYAVVGAFGAEGDHVHELSCRDGGLEAVFRYLSRGDGA